LKSRTIRISIGCLLTGLIVSGCSQPTPSIEQIERLQEAGRFAETIEPLRSLLDESPSESKRLFLYGRALWSTGRPGLALWPLKAAMEDPEYQLSAGLLYINALLQSEAWEDAERACDALLAELGEDNASVLTARAYARQGSRGSYEGVLADADRVLELEPDNRLILIPRTAALLALRRTEEAGEALEKLDALYRDDAEGLKGSAKFCTAGAVFAFEKGETDLAEERFDRCLGEFPTSSLLITQALQFFDARGEQARSLEILANALKEDPGLALIRTSLAQRLTGLGREDEAVEILLEGTQQGPLMGRIQAWTTAADFFSSLEDFDRALDGYQRAIALSTTRSPDLEFRLADTLIRGGRYPEALRWAEDMQVPAHQSMIRGRAHLEMGESAKALEHFTEGNRLWPNNAYARYYTAVAAERQGDFDRAIEEYRYAIRIDADATDAVLRLANYHLTQDADKKALQVLALTSPTHPAAYEIRLMIARISGRLGRPGYAAGLFEGFGPESTAPAEGLAAAAQGVYERSGAQAAVALVEHGMGLDLTGMEYVPLLAKLAEWLPEVDRASDGLELTRKAFEAHPEEAAIQALRARSLEWAGVADDVAVESLYRSALERKPDQIGALLGLARLRSAQPGGEGEAIELYRRALDLEESSEGRAERALAALLQAEGRRREAIEVLEALVQELPWDAEAALLLGEAYLEQSDVESIARSRDLLRRVRQLSAGARTLEERTQALERRLEHAMAVPSMPST
jgi:tetratricopeptide (TPR) repeat protein